jgi:hypothetical protein
VRLRPIQCAFSNNVPMKLDRVIYVGGKFAHLNADFSMCLAFTSLGCFNTIFEIDWVMGSSCIRLMIFSIKLAQLVYIIKVIRYRDECHRNSMRLNPNKQSRDSRGLVFSFGAKPCHCLG